MVRSLVPVSVRAPGTENVYDNQVSALLADLPVHVADPVERLAAVQAELGALKTAGEAVAGEALTTLGRYTPFPIASWGARLAFGLPQRDIVTVTTNVPGPRQPLYGHGPPLSWRSSPTSRSPPRSAPGSRSSPTAATSPSGSPATSRPARTSTYWPTASNTVSPSSWRPPRAGEGARARTSAEGKAGAGRRRAREPRRARGRRRARERRRRGTKASPEQGGRGDEGEPEGEGGRGTKASPKAKASPGTKASPVRRPPRPGT